jgi:hypothetical protein
MIPKTLASELYEKKYIVQPIKTKQRPEYKIHFIQRTGKQIVLKSIQ